MELPHQSPSHAGLRETGSLFPHMAPRRHLEKPHALTEIVRSTTYKRRFAAITFVSGKNLFSAHFCSSTKADEGSAQLANRAGPHTHSADALPTHAVAM